ncbi:hypothetical protein ACLMJK_003213 [Lecanora helva]
MTTKSEIQDLLRFLSQNAKVPLPLAMGKVKNLQEASLTSPESIAKTSTSVIQAIFADEKLAKQVLSAAKKANKKRASGESAIEVPAKRKKSADEPADPAAIEHSLQLPDSKASEEDLTNTVLHTNRAPLVLAFAVVLLNYTMHSQPLSSRLSLAQAVVSMNSKTKAISLGIDKGTSAENEGWGQGQPKVRIMGREVRIMKRWGYEVRAKRDDENAKVEDSQDTLKDTPKDEDPALWGLDLEALRSSNGPLVSGAQGANSTGLPVYHAESARAYLLKSFASVPSKDENLSPKKKTAAALKAEREHNLSLLLHALHLLYQSWAHVLGRDELDRRAWAWYVAVRPEVENGVAGWGGKGEVKLSQILDLRRKG